MKRHEVLLTGGAERDLEELHGYLTDFDSPEKAEKLLGRVLKLAETLATAPARGSVPKELRALGIREFRQLLLGPYRLIYRVIDDRVIIYVIADGRRNLQALLERRLLRD